MIKFPSIEQFRNVVKQVSENTRYQNSEKDEDGRSLPGPKNWKNPTLTFRGTVKLHGTNAGVSFNTETGEIIAQGRNRVLTLEHDNFGFALWVKSKEDHFRAVFKTFSTDTKYVIVFGEWAGPGIQKGVGISGIERKMFFPFAVMYANSNEDKSFGYQETAKLFNSDDIHSICNFENWSIDIDFENPEKAQNEMIAITEKVEAECPVAKYFGIENSVGEGVVWNCNDYTYKVKGEKHSVSKVKTLAPVDIEQLEAVQEFVEYAVTEERLEQGIAYLKEMEIPLIDKSTPHFLRWVVNDILKEETDTIVGNNLDSKKVNQEVSKRARIWYFEKGLE